MCRVLEPSESQGNIFLLEIQYVWLFIKLFWLSRFRKVRGQRSGSATDWVLLMETLSQSMLSDTGLELPSNWTSDSLRKYLHAPEKPRYDDAFACSVVTWLLFTKSMCTCSRSVFNWLNSIQTYIDYKVSCSIVAIIFLILKAGLIFAFILWYFQCWSLSHAHFHV